MGVQIVKRIVFHPYFREKILSGSKTTLFRVWKKRVLSEGDEFTATVSQFNVLGDFAICKVVGITKVSGIDAVRKHWKTEGYETAQIAYQNLIGNRKQTEEDMGFLVEFVLLQKIEAVEPQIKLMG